MTSPFIVLSVSAGDMIEGIHGAVERYIREGLFRGIFA